MIPVQQSIPDMMSMTSIDGPLGAWSRVGNETGAPFTGPEGAAPEPSSFSGFLERYVNDARVRDVEAQRSVEAFARGDDPGRIHETMVAVSKAEIALRTMTAVRNKLLSAYKDILQTVG